MPIALASSPANEEEEGEEKEGEGKEKEEEEKARQINKGAGNSPG